MPRHTAQLHVVGVPRKGVERLHIAAQHPQIGVEVFRKEASDHDLAVERHADAVDRDGEMAQHIVKQGLVFRPMLLHAAEEILERHVEALLDPQRGAVGLQTAAFAAGAGQPPRLNADVTELAAAGVVAGAELAVHQHGPAHAVFQRQIGHVPSPAAHEALRVPAGGAVVFKADGVGQRADQIAQRDVALVQRRRDEQTRVVGREQPRDRNADAQQPSAVDGELVDEVLDRAREGGGVRAAGEQLDGQRAVGELAQPQIGRDDAQIVLRHGDAQRDARFRDDVQTLRAAAAGELVFARVADQPVGHQIAQVLIESGHAYAAAGGQHLFGAEFSRLAQKTIDTAAGRQRIAPLSLALRHLIALPSDPFCRYCNIFFDPVNRKKKVSESLFIYHKRVF